MSQYTKDQIERGIERARADGNTAVVDELTALLKSTGANTKAESVQPPTPVEPKVPAQMGSSTGFYRPDPSSVVQPGINATARGMIADMALEGGGAGAGAMIGALPALSVPTAGLSIPAGAAIGGFIGNMASQARRGEKYKIGEGVGAAVSSAVMPGAGAVARSGVRGAVREAVKQGATNLGAVVFAKGIDEGELPDAGEAAIAAAAGVAGAGLNVLTTSGKGVTKETKQFLKNTGRDWIMHQGNSAGYVFDAVKSNENAATKMVARIGGESEIHKQAIKQNQEVTNNLVRQELGMPETWSISELNVKGAVANAKKPYGKLKELGPDVKAKVNELEDVRRAEREAWAQWRDKGGAEPKEKAVAAGKIAEGLENELEEMATASGKPGLVDELRAGRVQLGKLYTLQYAGNLSAGTVDARVLAAIDHEMPDKLTGGLKLAAQVAAVQPHMFVPLEKVVPKSTRTGQVTGGLIGAGAGAAIAQKMGAGPAGTYAAGAAGFGLGAGAAAAAQELLSTPFQRLANSQTYQQALGVPRYQLNAPEAIPTYLLQAAKAAGR